MTSPAMRIIGLAGIGSAAMLLGALAFQYLGDLTPCKLCLWQRWPHGGAMLLAVMALLIHQHSITISLTGIGAMLIGAGLALYHTGIERTWWLGPDSCSGTGNIGILTPEQLLSQIMAAPVVRCDEVTWVLAGLSMASWNGLISLALAGLWYAAWQHGRTQHNSAYPTTLKSGP